MNLFLRELNVLRAQRVLARKNLDRAALIFPDPYERRQFLEHQAGFLRGSERRWQELHHILGRPLPGKPIRLR
jgi:hypothetical protein